MPEFTHLHVHTEYSLLDGSSKIGELVARAKELGMDSLAITDHGVMYGVIDFYKAALAEGIKPIIGCEVYVAPNSRFDRELGSSEDRYYHLVLLAENNKGYSNLMKIVSKGFTEGFYYKPRVDYEVLEQYHEGVIALSACLAGVVATNLRRGFYEEAKTEALRLYEIFGPEHFYLELQDHGIPEQRTVNQGLMRMHEETGIGLVATNDSHYTFAEDAQAHDILLCIQTQKKVSDEDRMRYEGGQFYLKSPDEMAALFPYALEAIENTARIAKRCEVTIEFGKYKLPVFDVPDGFTAFEYLRKLCEDGLEHRYGERAVNLRERLEYELTTISSMGFVDYFLIVWDFIKYARDHEIMVGPGRGSAAGSIVSYCLGITDIDPIRYQLIFERFLNPERKTMPDIDVDFCYERRQEVIDYVTRKYGRERVVQIVTFGTMSARMVLRDVGRALDLPYSFVDSIAKMIPMENGITIAVGMEMNRDLMQIYESDTQAKHLIDMAKRLEGLPRHTSMHAAGVVISDREVDDYVPLSRSSDDTITTQYTMTTLESLGLLKMDFLGLRTLTVIQDAVKLINRKSEPDQKLDMATINYEDKKVYDMLGSGKTEGVFQLESGGMMNFMKELKPNTIEDVIAGISLYRPGPMDFIPKYIQGKNAQGEIQYECPELKPILEPTHGCIVYQEQVMQIVRDLAGYSFGRSDEVRRAMSKKKADVMKRERQNFVYGNEEEGVDGCIKRGIPEETAQNIYDEMMDFAKYAFNKSHAAAYAVVSYQTAYLKCYYPVEFLAALLTSVMDNTGKVSQYIMCCRQMGIQVLTPDINEGYGEFAPAAGGIRYGMSAIKGVGKPVIEALIQERTQRGPFTSMKDFASRLSGKEVNKRTIESFIKAGAMDALEGNRRQKMQVYAMVIDGVNQERKNNLAGQMSLFDLAGSDMEQPQDTKLPDVEEYEKETKLAFEKDVLGVYISGHPLEDYEDMWRRNISKSTLDFTPEEESGALSVKDGHEEIIGGMIAETILKTTRTNSNMAFLTIEDLVGTVEVIVFPKVYEQYKELLTPDNKVFIRGRVTVEEEKPAKLICQRITPFEHIPKEMWVQFDNKEQYQVNEMKLNELLLTSDGRDCVVVYLRQEKAMKRLPKNYAVSADGTLLRKLRNVFGEENARIVQKTIEKSGQKR